MVVYYADKSSEFKAKVTINGRSLTTLSTQKSLILSSKVDQLFSGIGRGQQLKYRGGYE